MKKLHLRTLLSAFMSALIVMSTLMPGLAAPSSGDEEGVPANAKIVKLPQDSMTVTANSFNPDHPPENVLDGNPGTMWHSEYDPENDPFPHILTIDLQKTTILHDISIYPRIDAGTGQITKGQIYAGDDLEDMTLVTEFTGDEGYLGDGKEEPLVVDLDQISARYIQIYSLETSEGGVNTAVSEVEITAYTEEEDTEDSEDIVKLPQDSMTVTANSFNPGYPPENVLDGNPGTMWHSEYDPENDPFPHILTIDLQKTTALHDISIYPRTDAGSGRITKGQLYAGDDLEDMALVTDFTGGEYFLGDGREKPIVVDLDQISARYIQIYSLETSAPGVNTAVSEVEITAYNEQEGPEDSDDIVEVPQHNIKATANTFNATCPPENVLDGNLSTLWHSEWDPENAPFPHILTLDLQETMLLHDISIYPRIDAGTGQITKGQIYAGDHLEDMALVTDFTGDEEYLGDGKEEPLVVDLDQISARYIQIYSLETSEAGENTAVSEVKVTAYSQPSKVADVPASMMSAEANSSNAGYLPGNAVDGDRNTIWHTEWTPESDPFPHILTIDLHKKLLLHTLTIIPRPDAGSGRITKGQIYIGDTPEDLQLYMDFTALDTQTSITLDMDQVSTRYIQIRSLAASSENTAIGEAIISTYDLDIVAAYNQYEAGLDLLRKSAVGDQVGEYAAEDVEAFEALLQTFKERLDQTEDLEGYIAITQEIADACESFILQAKAYTLENLAAMVESLETLVGQLQNQQDKDSAAALLERARQTHSNPEVTREEIHTVCMEVGDFMKAISAVDSQIFDLSGEWGLALSDYSQDMQTTDKVNLPGTLDTNKKGEYRSLQDISRLSRYYIYTGPAVYQKSLYISGEWAEKNISLYMERTRQTKVWVNGTEILAPDSSGILPVPQQYDITSVVKFGQQNTVTILVDNSYNNMPISGISASHMATEETQTNWNGILGEFKLQAREKVHIDDLRVYPNDDLQSVKIEADVRNSGDEAYSGTLTFSCPEAGEREINVSLDAGETETFTLSDYAMPSDVKLWSEFDRPLYEMTAELGSGDKVTETFGMRTFKSEDSSFTINGNKVFLRGEANCAVFPLTGYAPMDEAGWEKLFSTYQSYGINAVRFHSWCPPDAAFRVADRLGMYLQPELSCWEFAMLSDETRKNYYTREAFAIIKEYANHPSFVMLTFGNELSYQNNDYLEQGDKLVNDLKTEDPTRLYAAGSNIGFGGVDPAPHADFFTGQNYGSLAFRGSYGGLTGFFNQDYPSTLVNFDNVIDATAKFDIPVFSFEVGQYQIFPDVLTEPEQYTGVLEARNFAIVMQHLAEKGYSDEYVKKAIEASGMLSRLGYKAEIEAALRTEGMDGISLLGIQDFSGQGTALVGMMNAFGDPKPYDFADPDAFSDFFSPVVPLLEIEKFAWTNNETLTGRLLLSNYSQGDLEEAISYTLTDKDGKVFYEGKTEEIFSAQGSLTEAGTLSVPLDGIEEPTQFKLEITCADGQNSYNLWVYPAEDEADEGEVYITEYLDETALRILEEGGKVFLSPKASVEALPQSREGRFSTAFWSTNDRTQPGTMGLLMDPEHPLFANFPTDFHSDYQWWAMSKLGRPMNLESLTDAQGNPIQPLVTVIDGGFGDLERLGLLYEAAVGEGKLMVSSMGLEQLQDEYPEAKALRNAILDYMNSDAFDPTFQVEAEDIQEQVHFVKNNIASQQNGGQAFVGENTVTCQTGYDGRYADRLLEINDEISDVTSSSRAWTDYRMDDKTYPYDAEVGVELDKEYTVDSVAFAFFEDEGCKAPVTIRVKYWNGRSYADVSRQDKLDGFTVGMNTITFAPVRTDRLLFVMEHVDGMAVAISEMYVYEKKVNPESIQIRAEGDVQTVALDQTLQLYIDTQPDYANNRNVKWTVEDENGNPSELARVGFDGVLRPSGVGKIVVKASLRSDPTITASLELEITEADIPDPIVKGDLDKDGEVTIADVMEACKVMARESAGTDPTDDEIARGDLDGDGEITIADVMEICKILARQG